MLRILRRVILAGVGLLFVIAGVSKLINPAETVQVLGILGLPTSAAKVGMAVLPGLEVSVGCALLFRWISRNLLMITLSMLAAFTLVLALLAFGGYKEECSCFGPVIDSWAGGPPMIGILRNGALAAILIWSARSFHQPATVGRSA